MKIGGLRYTPRKENIKMKNKNECPKNCDNIDYIEDVIGGEIELWECKDCKKSFHVSIEIVRDFENAEVQNEKQN